jgi:hypothetical protein
VALERIDVAEETIASIIRVKRISELGKMLAVNSKLQVTGKVVFSSLIFSPR